MMSTIPNEKDVQDAINQESDGERSQKSRTQNSDERPATPYDDTKRTEGDSYASDAAAPEVAKDATEEPPSERPIERVASEEEYSLLSVSIYCLKHMPPCRTSREYSTCQNFRRKI